MTGRVAPRTVRHVRKFLTVTGISDVTDFVTCLRNKPRAIGEKTSTRPVGRCPTAVYVITGAQTMRRVQSVSPPPNRASDRSRLRQPGFR
jgi:hypothetical protein